MQITAIISMENGISVPSSNDESKVNKMFNLYSYTCIRYESIFLQLNNSADKFCLAWLAASLEGK